MFGNELVSTALLLEYSSSVWIEVTSHDLINHSNRGSCVKLIGIENSEKIFSMLPGWDTKVKGKNRKFRP